MSSANTRFRSPSKMKFERLTFARESSELETALMQFAVDGFRRGVKPMAGRGN
jgi:hypothetical protein